MNKIRFELKQSVGKIGDEESDFKRPMGVALDPGNNNVYIVDEGKRRVLIYSQKGEYLFSFPNKPQLLQGARGICIKFDRVYISEEFLSAISVFNMGGDFITQFNGKSSFQNNCFSVPTGLTLDDEENIYVCDCFNGRITILTNELLPQFDVLNHSFVKALDIRIFNKYLIVLDTEGVVIINTVNGKNKSIISNREYWRVREVNNPIFFDIDQAGNIYISDMYNHCIKIFSKRGKLLAVIASEEGDMFKSPTGIALASKTGVIVSVCNKEEGPLQFLKQI